ncbi:hypothetical protein Afil01_31490 [Actinorhabdospora filicis]|uniref:SCP1.201-like deaminase n=1 Tax=Actinorhabdospora filicis TaxID=1785913 RepID=A0A9W6SLX8_9ACTN|nr:DddA-like double-stranded DNA deaminase toxin [Actinorhabdospora filicis]GLZ78342.1 hypothetical protein Afil01_31490 [Actinorhabdospora filicis]
MGDDLSIRSLADRIRAGQSMLGEAQTYVVRAAEKLRAARDQMAALAGPHPGLQTAVAAADHAHGLSRPPFLALRGAVDDLDVYLGAIGAGSDVGSASRTHPSKRPISRPEPAPPAQVLEVADAQDLAEALRELDIDERRQFFEAVLTDERVQRDLDAIGPMGTDGRTTGVFRVGNRAKFITSGRQLDRTGVTDDTDWLAAVELWRQIATRFVDPHHAASMWDPDDVTHVETKAAAGQHTGRIKHSSLIINNPTGPCGGNVLGCIRLLEEYLGPGNTMTIYWPGGGRLVAVGRKR